MVQRGRRHPTACSVLWRLEVVPCGGRDAPHVGRVINADLLAVGGAQLLFNSLLRGLREVGRLDVLLYADQRLLQCVERAEDNGTSY